MDDLPDELRPRIADAAFEAIVVLDEGRVVWCNRAFEQMFRIPRDEVIGRAPFDFTSPEGHDRIREAIRTGATEPYEAEQIRADGTRLWGEVRGRAVTVGGRTYRVTTIRDTTSRRAMEAELRRSAERHRLLFEGAADGLMVMDRAGFPRAVNRRLCEMLGRSREELLAMSPDQAIAELDERPMRLDRLAAEASYVVERKLHHADGSLVDVEVNLTSISADEVLAVIRDIRQRKKAAAEQAALRNRLQQAQSLEAIGRLAGGVAHDFNNLLTVILAAARALSEGQNASREAADIVAAARRAAELTDRLSTFSRHRPHRPVPLDVAAHVVPLAPLLRRLLGEAHVLEIRTPDEALGLYMDPGELTQILMNLVVNARDAMASGGRITVTLGSSDDDRSVTIEVSDEGPGVPPDARDRLFEPFFTTKRDGVHSGLGLSTVYGIVKSYGGDVEVGGDRAGARFTIRLPRTRLGGEVPSASLAPPTRVLRIFVVEDDDAVRRAVAQMLLRAGHAVRESSGFEDAVRLAEAGEVYDVLLTDVVMPDGSGVVLADRLGAPCTLLMSGYPRDQLTGDVPYPLLAKPFTAAELLGAIQSAIGSSE